MSGTENSESQKRFDDLKALYDETVRNLTIGKAKAAALRRRVSALSSESSEHRTLRRRWVTRVTQPMILISQIQRSGGTLLSRLFDGHPRCFAHPMELSWGRPSKWD